MPQKNNIYNRHSHSYASISYYINKEQNEEQQHESEANIRIKNAIMKEIWDE